MKKFYFTSLLFTLFAYNGISQCTPPAAPIVTSPVYYCQNSTATQLTATGSNLLWGNPAQGTVGGTTAFTSYTYIDASYNNKKTIFTTNTTNVTLNTVDYYITSYQAVTGLVLSIYNSAGTVIATSSTNTSTSASATTIKITNTFNYTIAAAGTYSIGLSAGSGNIGSDNPAFPLTESTGTINITGVSVAGQRCFNNFVFTKSSSATAPVPVTTTVGTIPYYVTQTIAGCTSLPATINVIVNAATSISQIPTSGLIANYKMEGNANDAIGNDAGTLQNAPAAIADRFGNTGKALGFNGTTQYISTANQYANPNNFTVSIWFKTNTTTGGKLIGFGSTQTGASAQYDRHIYMANSGQLYFGVYPNGVKTINSPASYNDNNWHLATATLSAVSGMILYVDGAQVAADATTLNAQNYTGYWRIGYDNNTGWTAQSSSFYFSGSLDDALIYNRTLTASEVTTLYKSPDGAGNNGPVCSGAALSLSATTLSGGIYAWTGPNSFTSASQNPTLTYTAANAGVYTVSVSLSGCTSTAYTTVVSSTNAGQWTGNSSTDWADSRNWCNGTVPLGTTNVLITSGATRMPVISSSVVCNNLVIDPGATVTTAATGTLNIAGALTNNGTMTNSGTTNFNGTTQQNFSGVSNFYNLTVTNTAGLLLPTAIVVNNNFTLVSGTLTTNNFGISVAGNWTNNASAAAFVPGTSTVTFNGSTAQSIGGSFATGFNNLTISNTGNVVTLGANATIAGNLSVSSGTFNLSTFTANRTAAGGSLTVANNATLQIGGTNTFPINYSLNTLVVASTVEYAGTNQTVASQTYGNLKLSSSAGAAVKTLPAVALTITGDLISVPGAGTSVSFTATSTVNVNGNVSIGASTTFNGGGSYHTIGANWTNDGTFNGNTGTINFAGPGSSVGGSGVQNFNNLAITASLVTFSNSTISVSGNLTTSGSGSFSQATGGVLTMTGSGKAINGSGISLHNLVISGVITSLTSFNITGNLSVSGSMATTTGTITMNGASKTISGAGTKNFYGLSVTGSVTTDANFSIASALAVSGSLAASAGTATFTGTSTLSGTANLYNTTINGTSLQLSANSTLGIANVLTITAGTLNTVLTMPNTVNFNSTGAQNINALTYSNLVLSNGNTKTAAGNITTRYSLTIGTGTTFNPVSYTHTLYGNWINNGTFTPATSTVSFVGAATAYVTGATTFNTLTSNTTGSTTELILNDNITATTVNMINGIITTGSSMITITGTRTGNGYIYGNIRRNHSFTTGVAYAFEGPDNTINFSAVSSVTSITVSVVRASVADFPYGNAIRRLYTITVPTGTYTATLRLHYEDNELNGNQESNMGIWDHDGTITGWVPVGKTGNSTVSNYVEQSGLTNLAARWTCSINPSVVLWNGSVSNDWNTAANWSVYVGAGSTPPSASDVVVLGGIPFTYQPTIGTAVTVKNVVFSSTQAVNLSMTGSGSLNSGDIIGVWTGNLTHTINAGNQTITVAGDLSLSDGTSGHAINLSIGTGTVNISGSMNQSGGANISFAGGGNLNIGSNFNYTNGTFTSGTGTVTYNGSANQKIGAVNYNNLVINNASALVSIDNALTIAGNLSLIAGEFDNNAVTDILGNVNIASGATIQNFNTMHVGGNWNNNGNFIAAGAQIVFNGNGTQTISATTFNNIEINKPVGTSALLTGNIIINGDLTVTSGTFNIKTFDCNRSVQGGVITLANAATFIVGANNSPLNFENGTLAVSSTVIADGTSPQFIFGLDFGNLIFRNAGAKTLVSPINVKGDLTIESGASFDAGSQTLTINGNWINNGTFIPSTSTVICTGTAKNISGNNTFKRMSVYGSYTFLNDNTIDSLLVINPTGSLSGGSSITTTMNGDLVNKGVLYTLGTTTFTGNVLQTLSLINAVQTVAITVNFNGSVSPVLNSTSAPQYGYLNINNTGGVNPSVGWNILYGLTVGAGASFNLGSSTHNLLGYLTNNGTITSSGTFNFTPASSVAINMGTDFTSTGRVVFGGTGAITMSGTPVSFRNVTVSNTNAAGITPSSNWILTNNLTINSGAILNAANRNYSVAGNILNNGTINSGTSLFTLNANAAQDIYSASAFNNLTVNKSAGAVTISSNVTVNGTLNFIAGSIQTGSNRIIQSAAGIITNAAQNTGWVNGNLQKGIQTGATTKIFETGDDNYYTPATLAFNSVSGSGDITVRSIPGDHPYINSSVINASKSLNRYWSIANNGTGFTNADITFQYPASDLDAAVSIPLLGVSIYTGSSWLLPVTGTAGTTSTVATGVTSFGDFAIGEICNKGTSITYAASPYCSASGTATVTLTGNGGGTFASSAGLVIDPSTGTVTLGSSTAGTYNVTYSIDGTDQCASIITSASITITAAPTATGSYAGSPYCSNAGTAYPSGSGTGGGIFSSTTGLVIDANTGGIDLAASTAGTYTVTYTIAPSGGCTTFSWNTSVTITAAPTGTISYPNSTYCSDAVSAPVTHTGTNGGVYSSTSGLTINPSTGLVDLSTSQTGTYTVTYSMPSGGGCAAFQTTANITIVTPGSWTGAVNTDWNNAGNWLCGAVPTAATNVTIDPGLGFYPVITDVQSLHNLVVMPGGTMTIAGGTIRIAGTINNSGIFDVTNGTVEMIGSSAQTITANAFTNNKIKNLSISNDVNLAAEDTLTGTLTVSAGKTFATNDNLILRSDANGTARIAALPVNGLGIATAFISGKVSIERYIPMRKAWRLLAAPVRSTGAPSINDAWQEGTGTSSFAPNPNPGYGVLIGGGPTTNGFDQAPTNNPFLKVYNNATNNFIALPASPGTLRPVSDYPGYFLYIRGDRSIDLGQGTSAAITSTTLRMKGQVNTGSQVTNVNATNYTVLGNPFASAIDFETITKSNIKNSFYVWDPKLAGNYGLGAYVSFSWNSSTGMYDATTSASPLSKYIPSGEAVLVESADGVNPGTITIKESDKTASGSDAVFGRTNGLDQKLRVDLHAVNADSTTSLLDAVLTTFDIDNSNSIDNSDAKKLNGGSENIGIKRNGTMLSIERRKEITENDTIFLNIYQMKINQYELEINANNLGQSGTTGILKDTYSNSINNMQLDMNGITKVKFSINSDPASYAINRFSIVFKPLVVLPVTIKSIKAYRQQKDIAVEWTTENEINIRQYEVERSSDGISFNKINTSLAKAVNGGNAAYKIIDTKPMNGNNYYRIRSVEQTGKTSYSSIVKVAIEVIMGEPGIVIYPNPVTGNTISMQFNNIEKGSYTVHLFDAMGRLVSVKTIQHDGIASTESFEVSNNFAAGKYELRLTGDHVQLNVPVIKK